MYPKSVFGSRNVSKEFSFKKKLEMCKKIEFEKLGPEKSKNRAHRFWPKSPNSVHKKLKTDIYMPKLGNKIILS